jgi:ribosomal protein S12 methylthiotransferase accessory factor
VARRVGGVIESTLTPRLRRAVSSYTGIVRTIEECLASSAEPRLFRATCDVQGGAELVGSPLRHCSGIGGAGVTRSEAAAAAVGEALERYSASYVPRERLLVATARELGAATVTPERFALFRERQYALPGFPFRRFTVDTRVAWVEGQALPAGEAVLLPAELVFLGDAGVGEPPIGYATSSGAACGEARTDTLVRGICELLERDAFMIAWAARLSLPLLEWSAAPALVELDRRFFAPTGLAYAALDLSRFHDVPSVLGVVRARAGFPGALGVGAGTAATIERAWFKALAEAFAARSAGAKLELLETGAYGPHGEGVCTFEDHIRYYADEARAAAAAFLDASTARTPVGDVRALSGDPLAALCARVGAAGSSVYAVDVTSPDVAALGLVVTKVVAPELCALDVVHGARFLGGRRLYEAPFELGLRAAVLTESELNPDPHPFP